jgi:hypothetical protein
VTYVGFVPFYLPDYLEPFTESRTWEDCAIEGLHGSLNHSRLDLVPNVDATGYDMYQDLGVSYPTAFYVTTPDRQGWQARNTIKCQLYNSSYSMNFTFDNGLQDIKYKIKELNGVSALDGDECRMGRRLHHCNSVTAYLSLMNAMGDLLWGFKRHVGENAYTDHRTMIGSTTLIESPDMHTFYREKPKSPIKYMSMGDTLEEFFTNATISLFSNSEFLKNDTAASYGPITRFSAQNAFSYEPRNLFIAYGIGIMFSFVVVIYGLLCIKSASASYANSFSTILWTTRNPDIDTVITTTETSGAEPLPKHLGNVRLLLRRQGNDSEGGGDKAAFFAVDPKLDDGKRATTESSLKQDRESRHSDTDEISNTQESPDVNLYHRKDNENRSN